MNPDKVILSVFPGADLLGKAFEQNGFCVLRSPDINFDGGDIRHFHIPVGVVYAIIGGPPCQDFSGVNRFKKPYGGEMLLEYQRVVLEAQPEWFLLENVKGLPLFSIDGYTQQRFELDLAWFAPFTRRRIFVFGSKNKRLLNPMIQKNGITHGGAVTSRDGRYFSESCVIQGLPSTFDLPFLSKEGKNKAVANGVPLQMGDYLAKLILRDFYQEGGEIDTTIDYSAYKRCLCGCGRIVTGWGKHAHPNCRKRTERKRKKMTQLR